MLSLGFLWFKATSEHFFLLHVDVKPGVQATSLLCSQHLEGPQTTALNSENKYQKATGQNSA